MARPNDGERAADVRELRAIARRARCMIPSAPGAAAGSRSAAAWRRLGLPGVGGERVVVAGGGGLVLPRRGEHAGEGDDRAEDQGDGGDDSGEAAGVGEHGRKLRPVSSPVVARGGDSCVPRAGDAAIIREADETALARRYLAAIVRISRPQLIDLAIALPITLLGVLEALARDNTGRWLTAALVNGAALTFRRRSPLVALVGRRRRAGARARRDLRHRPAVAVPGRADPDVHRRLRAAAAAGARSATRSASCTS